MLHCYSWNWVASESSLGRKENDRDTLGGGCGGKGGLGNSSSNVLCKVGERLDSAQRASQGYAHQDPATGPTMSGCSGGRAGERGSSTAVLTACLVLLSPWG